jgi:hypothetical protein
VKLVAPQSKNVVVIVSLCRVIEAYVKCVAEQAKMFGSIVRLC